MLKRISHFVEFSEKKSSVGKRRKLMLVSSIFSFSQKVFHSLLLHGPKTLGFCVKE